MNHTAKSSYITAHLTALSLFILISLIMTYPLALNINSAVLNDPGDPLLTTWILAWDVHKIQQMDILNLFNANIFYPNTNTLAYSEHMIAAMLFAFPVMTVFKNPVLAYNITFIMSMALSGFGMYLLASFLTANRPAAFCAGLIFAFSPWRFSHLGHIQLQMAQWMPLTFLYLQKFTDMRKQRHLFMFTGFFVLQCLSNGYYALFLSFFTGLYLLMAIFKQRFSDTDYLFRTGIFLLISAVFLLPFFYPYWKVKQEMGFSRSLDENVFYSADVLTYLSAPEMNKLWGYITRHLAKAEGFLFPGLSPMLFALLGMAVKSPGKKPASGMTGKLKYLLYAAVALLISALIVIAALLLSKEGFRFSVFGLNIRATHLYRPLVLSIWLSCIITLLHIKMQYGFRGFISAVHSGIMSCPGRFYFIMLVSAALFSFGPYIFFNSEKLFCGPYYLLYNYLPGFSAIRVPARFTIMTILATAVFSAFGISNILNSFRGYGKKLLSAAVIAGIILLEFVSFPLPVVAVPAGDDIPDVYKWLSKTEGDFAILELPLPKKPDEQWKETEYVYYSTYHWKKLVNGYSGYFPENYLYLIREGLSDFPSASSVDLLKGLDIKYLIMHFEKYAPEERESIKKELGKYPSKLKLYKNFNEDYVYDLF